MNDKSGTLNWALFLPPRIRLRVATPNDRAIRALLYADMREDEPRSPSLAKEQLWQKHLTDQFKLREQQVERSYPNATVLMIEARGAAGGRFAIVGTLTFKVSSTAERSKLVQILTIELSTATRGRGIGSQVIEALASSARAYGARRIEMVIPIGIQRLDAFCERLGFRSDEAVVHMSKGDLQELVANQVLVRDLKSS